MGEYSNIVLFATYWNEIEWIEASLAQIDKINPKEIIICDGCFDPKYPPYSTDGTREIIESFVASRNNAKLISPIRESRLNHLKMWFQRLPHEQSNIITMPKLKIASKHYLLMNVYRLNQASTFNYMIRESKHFKKNTWFMTYDCDQFYSDQMIDEFNQIGNDHQHNIYVGKEYTFFNQFNQYSQIYEKRDYNNMPHRVTDDIRFIPTRNPARVHNGSYAVCSTFDEKKKNVGIIYHYRIRSKEREEMTYQVGDRKPPEKERTETQEYKGEHPNIIKKFFNIEK